MVKYWANYEAIFNSCNEEELSLQFTEDVTLMPPGLNNKYGRQGLCHLFADMWKKTIKKRVFHWHSRSIIYQGQSQNFSHDSLFMHFRVFLDVLPDFFINYIFDIWDRGIATGH